MGPIMSDVNWNNELIWGNEEKVIEVIWFIIASPYKNQKETQKKSSWLNSKESST